MPMARVQPRRPLLALLVLSLARPAAAAPVHIEVALQAGGESEAVFAQLAADFHATHPDVIADLETDPRIADKLRVRILEKDFPEVTNANLSGLWNLIHHGDVADLSRPLAGPCWGPASVPSWRASFLPGVLDRFAEGGHTYSVPLSYYAWTIWYDKRLFRAHGWAVPRTWDQLLSLCATIKATGLPPFAFQGRYPYYGQMFVDGAYYQLAGPAAFLDQKRLEPGTFDNPLMVQALTWTPDAVDPVLPAGCDGHGPHRGPDAVPGRPRRHAAVRVVVQERDGRQDPGRLRAGHVQHPDRGPPPAATRRPCCPTAGTTPSSPTASTRPRGPSSCGT